MNASPRLEEQPPIDRHQASSPFEKSELFFAILAFLALGVIAALAFFTPAVELSDRIILFPLGLAALALWIPRVLHRADHHPDVAAFLITAVIFVIYGLARSAGPDEGVALRFAFLPDDQFVVPYSAYVVVFSALLCSPLWWRHRNLWKYSLLAAIAIVALLTALSFNLLRGYFPTGPTEILDPAPLPKLAMNLVEYGCLALLCQAVAARAETRRLALRLLAVMLLLLWARHQFFAAPVEAEAEAE